jgi:hypothetical protein
MTRAAIFEEAVAARFAAVNGDHAMTPADDDYAAEWFVPLDQLAADEGIPAAEIRRLILANRLPLPSYIGSDGTQFAARDLLALARRAGGFEQLPDWFASQFDEPAKAVAEWDAYLAGHNVCLRSVQPENMKRKDALVAAIEAQISSPQPDSPAWLEELHGFVDELDALEPPFAPYDRLRFGGPVSRDRLIDHVRTRFPAAESLTAEQLT